MASTFDRFNRYNCGGKSKRDGTGPFNEGVTIRPMKNIDEAGNPTTPPRELASKVEDLSGRTARKVAGPGGNSAGLSADVSITGAGAYRPGGRPAVKRY
jgi:hypothetical protein